VAAFGAPDAPRGDGGVRRGAGAVTRACIDRTEAALLAGRVGEEFDAVVLRGARPGGGPGEVYVHEPTVLARCTGSLRLGETSRVRLVEADPGTGHIAFTVREA
jgi:exoribonuclease R